MTAVGPAAGDAAGRWKLRAARLGLLTASILVVLILGEGVVRVFSPGYSPLFLKIYRQDESGLILLQPGVSRSHVTAEWQVMVSANSEGLRDRETPLPGPNGTVLGIGDSFAFGWGVELEESFYYLAEEGLRADGLRLVKAGMPGFGTTDQLAFLEWYGDRYRPRLVVLALFVGNDFTDVQRGGVPGQFTVEDGLMIRAPIEDGEQPPPSLLYRAKAALKHSSLLAQYGARAVWYLERRFIAPRDKLNPGLSVRDRSLWEFAKVHLSELRPETQRAYDLTLAALDQTAEWCRERDVPLLLVTIPRSFQIYAWELEKWKESYSLTDDMLELDRPQRALNDWAHRSGTTVLDLLPHMREHAKRHPEERLYFYPNSHMNVAGHALTGELIARSLKEALGS